ncbi:hypothetical protein HK096_011299 [Nowakowskiella sp. JEL0078]|nr:hypothetical protein HK096_011299 [Nowakowskiella sp. JEL0078]
MASASNVCGLVSCASVDVNAHGDKVGLVSTRGDADVVVQRRDERRGFGGGFARRERAMQGFCSQTGRDGTGGCESPHSKATEEKRHFHGTGRGLAGADAGEPGSKLTWPQGASGRPLAQVGALRACRRKLTQRRLAAGNLDTRNGVSLLDVKIHSLLSYLAHLSVVALCKTTATSIRDCRSVAALCELRTVLEKIKPLELKLKYRIDKLVASAQDDDLKALVRLRLCVSLG